MAIKFNINGRVERYDNCYLLPEHELGTLDADQFLRERGVNDKEPLYKTFSDEWIKIQVDPDWISFSIIDKECVRTVGEPNGRKFGFRFSVFIPRSQSFSSAGLVQSLREFKQWGLGQLQSNGLSYQVNPEEWRNVKEKFKRAILQDRRVSLSGVLRGENQIEQAFANGQTELKKDNTDGIALRYANDQTLGASLPNWLEKLGKAGKLSLFPSGSTAAVAMPFGESKLHPDELMEMNDSSFILLWGEQPRQRTTSKPKQPGTSQETPLEPQRQFNAEKKNTAHVKAPGQEQPRALTIEAPEETQIRLKVARRVALAAISVCICGGLFFFVKSFVTPNFQEDERVIVLAPDSCDLLDDTHAAEDSARQAEAAAAEEPPAAEGAPAVEEAPEVEEEPAEEPEVEEEPAEEPEVEEEPAEMPAAEEVSAAGEPPSAEEARRRVGESPEDKWNSAKGRAQGLDELLDKRKSLDELAKACQFQKPDQIDKTLKAEHQSKRGQSSWSNTNVHKAFWLIKISSQSWEQDHEEFEQEWKRLRKKGIEQVENYMSSIQAEGQLDPKWFNRLERLVMPSDLQDKIEKTNH